MKIYLAGKINPENDWREDLVENIGSVISEEKKDHINDIEWPILKNSIFGKFDYVGPYYCKPENYTNQKYPTSEHGMLVRDNHGCIVFCSWDTEVKAKILSAIDICDIFVAYIYDLSCFGTIFEIGYARAKNKPVFVFIDAAEDCLDAFENYYDIMGNLWLSLSGSCWETVGEAGFKHKLKQKLQDIDNTLNDRNAEKEKNKKLFEENWHYF